MLKKKVGSCYQVFLRCISLTSISNKDIVEWLFILERQLVNAHVRNPGRTGCALGVPSMDDARVMILGMPANLTHIKTAQSVRQRY